MSVNLLEKITYYKKIFNFFIMERETGKGKRKDLFKVIEVIEIDYLFGWLNTINVRQSIRPSVCLSICVFLRVFFNFQFILFVFGA